MSVMLPCRVLGADPSLCLCFFVLDAKVETILLLLLLHAPPRLRRRSPFLRVLGHTISSGLF